MYWIVRIFGTLLVLLNVIGFAGHALTLDDINIATRIGIVVGSSGMGFVILMQIWAPEWIAKVLK